MTLLKAILEACPLAIVALDRNGIVRMWSRGAEEMFGLTESKAVGNPLPMPLELLEAQLHASSRRAIELTWLRRNGEPLHVSSSGAPLRDERGEIQGKVVIFADITSRRESEQERAELVEREQAARAQAKAERRFRELLEAAPDAILEIDADGRIVLLNEVAEKMFGYRRAELLGQRVEINTLLRGGQCQPPKPLQYVW